MSATTLTCPKCCGDMHTYERSGVTVDQCGECRGIFLDRGELERLVDAEQSWHSDAPAPRETPYRSSPQYGDDRSGYRERSGYGEHDHDGSQRKRRKKSFFDDLFD